MAVILDSISLLLDRDRKGMIIEINLFVKSELKVGLRHRTSIKLAKRVIDLRMLILVIIVLNTKGCPSEMSDIVDILNEENSIILIFKANLSLQIRSP